MENKENTSPDYSRYTIAELEDVLANIDREKYAQRYADAQAMLAKRRDSLQANPQSDAVAVNSPMNPSWSEMHSTTRVIMAVFLLLVCTLIPTAFVEFIAAKTWLEHTNIWIWGMSLVLGVVWVISLIKDEKFIAYLARNVSGKIAAISMPFLFLLLNFILIDKTMPLVLHVLSAQQQGGFIMQYRKVSKSRRCPHKVAILETEDLEQGRLCMAESVRNSLAETGSIVVTGSRSQFGMVIDGFIPM